MPNIGTDSMGCTVLWIDDHPASIEACIHLLRLDGVHVEPAASGTLGIALAAARAFDLILLDLRLPDLSGLEVLHELRRAGVDTPVAVVSGFLTGDGIADATRLGATAFVRKPVFCEDITSLVRAGGRSAPARSAASPARLGEQEGGFAAFLRALERAPHLTNGRAAINRALLAALVDPTVSTMAYGICARAFRVLCSQGDGAMPELGTIMAKAPVAERGNCPTTVAHALADIECLGGFARPSERTMAAELRQAAMTQRLKAWTDRSYLDWKRVVRIRPVLELLVATNEYIAQIAYKVGYEHPSHLDHDFDTVLGISPKLFRGMCRTYGVTSSAECINSHPIRPKCHASAQAIEIDGAVSARDADRPRGTGVQTRLRPDKQERMRT